MKLASQIGGMIPKVIQPYFTAKLVSYSLILNCITRGFVTWFTSPNASWVIKSKRMIWAEHVARMGEMRNAYKILVGKSEAKRPRGRLRRRWGLISE
jgi:hypothetical protein